MPTLRAAVTAVTLKARDLGCLGFTRLLDAERSHLHAAAWAHRRARTMVQLRADWGTCSTRFVGRLGADLVHPPIRVGRDLRLYLRQPDPDGAVEAAGAYALSHDARPLGSDL